MGCLISDQPLGVLPVQEAKLGQKELVAVEEGSTDIQVASSRETRCISMRREQAHSLVLELEGQGEQQEQQEVEEEVAWKEL